MTTQQINIRIETDLAAALDRVAREESLDRATTIRRLLERSIREWELEHAVLGVQRGDLALGRAAEESGLSMWELLDSVRVAGVAHPLTGEDARERLGRLGAKVATLPDIAPTPGGVLLVGINPAPISATAGHYYQGRLGRRLWRRLEGVGLLRDATPGAEDEAFAAAGHGLTDLVKRPTTSADMLTEEELLSGVEILRGKVRAWRPGVVLFAFRPPAERLIGPGVKPGRCGEVEGITAFLLSGPYAPAKETVRVDRELRDLLGDDVGSTPLGASTPTQRVTGKDLERGQIRLPRDAKRFFPSGKAKVEIVIRGSRAVASYEPRTGPDRERSAVLHIGKDALSRLVTENEVLVVRRGKGGVPQLE